MKTHTLTVTLTVCLLCTLATYAMTRQWSVPAGTTISSLQPDGKGGCAASYFETNGSSTVIWVDKKGTVKYEKSFAPGTHVLVVKCESKMLVYATHSASSSGLVQVDKKGQETTASGQGVIATLAHLVSKDKKGFFILDFDTNQTPSRADLVRYSDK